MNVHADRTPLLIAIVDDEPDITAYLGAALEDAGYRVVELNAAERALEILRQQRPDLICLDLLMPRQTGASLYREIRRDELLAPVPVLILSGLNARAELDGILQGDADRDEPAPGYLEKPVEPAPFLSAVRELLERADRVPEGPRP